jgi:AraC-like DNA-binding protein
MVVSHEQILRYRRIDDIVHRMSDFPQAEYVLHGRELGLPMVESLAAVHCRCASRITWHSHPMIELLFLIEGATEYEFAGGGIVELPGSHFLIVPRGVRHRGLHDVRRPARLCGIVFDPCRPNAAANTPFTRRDLAWVAKQCECYAARPWPMNAELRRSALSLADQVQGFDRTAAGDSARLRLTACAMLFDAALQATLASTVEPNQAVRAAIACMESCHGDALSIEDVAKSVGCSRARLFQIFKQATGMTPGDFLQRLRITKAAELLQSTQRPVTDIAFACGFTTSQYFSNVFRKHFGATPTTFRGNGQSGRGSRARHE